MARLIQVSPSRALRCASTTSKPSRHFATIGPTNSGGSWQDPPELVGPMVAKWREGFDVVLAQRKAREGETWIKRAISAVGYRFINRIAEVNIPPDTGDFRLLSRRVVEELKRLKECH